MKQQKKKSESTFSQHGKGKKLTKNNQPHVPRPRNAFIMFRQYYHRSVQGGGPRQKNNSEVSKELGLRWKVLPPQEKSYWERLARDEKELFARKYEEYRFVNGHKPQKPEQPAHTPTREFQPSPPMNDRVISIPPISDLVHSHIWLTPPQGMHPGGYGSYYGAVHPRSFQLPYPEPQHGSYLGYRSQPVQPQQFYPSPIPQRLPSLSSYAPTQYQQHIPGNHTYLQETQRSDAHGSEIHQNPAPFSILNA